MPSFQTHALPAQRHRENSDLLAVLGPTNTGKTYFAIERMLSCRSGMIGLPLRLLAREVYDKLVARCPVGVVALVTGEEKIIPKGARYWVSTVEAMPLERNVDFLAIDEIQLCGDVERGRIFTSRLLHARGQEETLFLGSETMRPMLSRLFPGIRFESKKRFSALSYAGPKKISRLPRRSAIVAFSTDAVYAIAELVRRQRGGAAVVLGALSPRTRNAQAALYQSGEVDYLIATDAIGMGLNMDINHVAFAAQRKFDGRAIRDLRTDELAQIAGRAGRYTRNGTFGVTGECPPFDDDRFKAIEDHNFDPLQALHWRSDRLDFSNIHALRLSLNTPSPRSELKRARPGDDELAFARLSSFADLREKTNGTAATLLLWDVCQVPDFRKVSFDQHAIQLREIYDQLIDDGRIAEAWLAPKVERLERTDGDIDAISTRISYIRTWTYLTNRPSWVENSAYWREKTRAIEDSLSDALHEKLTQRFVDRRTSVLLKKLRDDEPLLAGVAKNGDVVVEGQFVGRLLGFEYIVDPTAKGVEAKKVRLAAERALAPVLATRAAALVTCDNNEFDLRDDGTIGWRQSTIATLSKGPAPLRPNILIKGLDAITPSLRGRVQDRLQDFVAIRIEALLGDLLKMKFAVDKTGDDELSGLARGIGFRLVENFGAMSRSLVADELKQLGQDDRAKLRRLGIRFGEYTLFTPSLLKPAPAKLLISLWALWSNRDLATTPPPKAGLVSIALDKDMPHAYYYAAGYRPSGERAVRIDMLERLAQMIRSDRDKNGLRGAFEASSQMMSIVGCSGDEFEAILRSLGYRKQSMKRPPAPAPTEPVDPEAIAAEKAADANAKKIPLDETPTTAIETAQPVSVTQATETAAPVQILPGAMPQTEPNEQKTPINDQISDSVGQPSEQQTAADLPTEEKEIEAKSSDIKTAEPRSAETKSEDAKSVEDDEIFVWRFQQKRTPQKRPQKSNDRDSGKSSAPGQNRKPRGKGRGPNSGPHRGKGKPPGPKTYSAGPKRNKQADPDSPFAILAALKENPNDGSKKGK